MKSIFLGIATIGFLSCTHQVVDSYRTPSATQSSEIPQLIHFDRVCKDLPLRQCFEKMHSHGSRLTTMGFLAHSSVAGRGGPLESTYKHRLIPMGFALPFSYYDDFMKINVDANPKLRQALTQLTSNNSSDTPPSSELIKTIQTEILNGEVPQVLYKKAVYELEFFKKQVKFEYITSDLEEFQVNASYDTGDENRLSGSRSKNFLTANFSKTSFYDAKIPCRLVTEKDQQTGQTTVNVEPKSLACAIKGIYANFWSLESLQERATALAPHKKSSVAITIETPDSQKKDFKIYANSKVATKISTAFNIFGYEIVTSAAQKSKPDISILKFNDFQKYQGLSYLQTSSKKPLLSEEVLLNMSDITRKIEEKYCETFPELYLGTKCHLLVHNPNKKNFLNVTLKVYNKNEITIDDLQTFTGD